MGLVKFSNSMTLYRTQVIYLDDVIVTNIGLFFGLMLH